MKLAYAKYNLVVELDENAPCVLVFENPGNIAEFLQDFHNQYNGQGEYFVLSEGEKIQKVNKTLDYLIDPFSLDFNKKSILNKLYGTMMNVAEELVEERAVVNTDAQVLLERILDKIAFTNVSYQTDFNWGDFFKMYDVKIETLYETLEEKLSDYIKISSSLGEFRGILMVNIKAYLTEEQLLELYQLCAYCKMSLLLVETSEKERVGQEKIYILDKDQCLIIK